MTPVVFIPGLACSAELFSAQLTALWPHGPVSVASTLEGRSMAEIAASILSTAPPRFALAGLSMGGYVSLEIMRQAPQRVVKLALIDTSARPDLPEQAPRRRALVDKARSEGVEAAVDEMFPALVHPAHRNDPALFEINRRMARDVGVEAFARQQEAIIARPDSRPDLMGISVPCTVIVGDSDQITPPSMAEETVAGITGARLVAIADSGHFSTLEQPEAVSRALAEWITG